MTTGYKQDLVFLGIALGGPYGRGKTKFSKNSTTTSSMSSYEDLSYHYGDLVDGAPVVDKSKLSVDQICSGLSYPNLDVDLPDGCAGDWDRQPFPFSADRALAKEMGPDGYRAAYTVSLDIHVEMCRRMGARVGKRQGDQIVWEDGGVEDIRPFEDRRIPFFSKVG